MTPNIRTLPDTAILAIITIIMLVVFTDSPPKATTPAIEMLTTSRGLECVRYEPCGLSCNWPKFSTQQAAGLSTFNRVDTLQ